MIMLAESEGPDQTVRMRRLIWAFAVRIYQKTFSLGAANVINHDTGGKLIRGTSRSIQSKCILLFSLEARA